MKISDKRIRAFAKKYTGKSCTLNGSPAKIIAYLDFATVVVRPMGACADFLWQTVDRIMKKGGKFEFRDAL